MVTKEALDIKDVVEEEEEGAIAGEVVDPEEF